MEILQYQNTPNFKSNIKFVNLEEFTKHNFTKNFYCSNNYNRLSDSFAKGENIMTWGVRSCTSGGIVDEMGSIGFHIYDSPKHHKEVKKKFISTIKDLLVSNPKSALILGSKDFDRTPESVPLFNTICRKINSIVKPSLFKTFTHQDAETAMVYDKKSDTWFINAVYYKYPMIESSRVEINSLESLKSMFKKIRIASQDRLFIGEKEITKEHSPELFY